MAEIAPPRVEFLLVDFAACIALAQDFQGLVTSARAALSEESA